MVMQFKKWWWYRRSFMCSIIFHALLFSFLYQEVLVKSIGVQHPVIVQAYLFTAKDDQTSVAHVAATPQEKKLSNLIKQPQKSHGVVKYPIATPAKSIASVTKQQVDLTPGMQSLLLKQLHDDIARHLIYPDNAVALGLSGIVTVKFFMQPSGMITEVSVLHSSGFPILDDAARSTLNAISPFIPAEHYLHASDYFTIPVDFELH